MAKYLLKRILYGIMSVAIVVAIIMIMVCSLLHREKIFRSDPVFQKNNNNAKITYMFQKWEEYGYLDYVTYEDYLNILVKSGELTEESRKDVASLGRTADKDSELVAEYVEKFRAIKIFSRANFLWLLMVPFGGMSAPITEGIRLAPLYYVIQGIQGVMYYKNKRDMRLERNSKMKINKK